MHQRIRHGFADAALKHIHDFFCFMEVRHTAKWKACRIKDLTPADEMMTYAVKHKTVKL